jgi:hypothetical protein
VITLFANRRASIDEYEPEYTQNEIKIKSEVWQTRRDSIQLPSRMLQPPIDPNQPMSSIQQRLEISRKKRELYNKAGAYLRQKVSTEAQRRKERPYLGSDSLQHPSTTCELANLQSRIDANSLGQLSIVHINQKEALTRMARDLKLEFPQEPRSLRGLSVSGCPSQRRVVIPSGSSQQLSILRNPMVWSTSAKEVFGHTV